MSKRLSRLIALAMFLLAAGFVFFALNHPEMAWPWSNKISCILYLVYGLFMLLFLIAPFREKK